jgi:hypothetical protein
MIADRPTVRVTGNDEIEVEMHEVFMLMLRKEAQLRSGYECNLF